MTLDRSVRSIVKADGFDKIWLSSGQIMRVHSYRDCMDDTACVIHNPSVHPLDGFELFWRSDKRIFERICNHGVGHPDPDSLRYEAAHNGTSSADYLSLHGDICICCAGAYEFLRENTVGEFVTKDSGKRVEFTSGMVRDTDEGKPRFDLIRPLGVPYKYQMLTRFAELMARGAKKYKDRNWEQANGQEELDRMKGSALRHAEQWFHGETDEDHAAAVFFNIMAYEATKYKMENQ